MTTHRLHRILFTSPALALAGVLALGSAAAAEQAALQTAPVRAAGGDGTFVVEGVVEAVRQSVIAAEVPGAITALPVHAGDAVAAGATLLRIDERTARQQAQANAAQAEAANAELVAARKEFDRSEQLFHKKYISQAAMEQAQAQFDAAQAQARAHLAQAGAASTQESLHTVRAPYAGVLASVDVQLGDMAAPGRSLMTLYDPAELRVVVTLPEGVVRDLLRDRPVAVEVPAAQRRDYTVAAAVVLPAADPQTHTLQVRLPLGASGRTGQAVPGMFARARLPLRAQSGSAAPGRLLVPARSVLRRTELNAVYVVDASGRALLRQVRLGALQGSDIEVLAGLEAGERVALDPAIAGRQ